MASDLTPESSASPSDSAPASPTASGRTLVWTVLALMIGACVVIGLFAWNRSDQSERQAKTQERAQGVDEFAKSGFVELSADNFSNWIREFAQSSGSRFVVVNIWATWCEPCRQEMPELLRFQLANPVALALISADQNNDEGRREAAAFLQPLLQMSLEYELTGVSAELKQERRAKGLRSAIDASGEDGKLFTSIQEKMSEELKVEWSLILPTTLIFDAEGRMRHSIVGETRQTDLEQLIAKLSAE
ncbi:MAG TPA: TlpA disulfide reductase family protein [Pseudobdellovibrionaceae bacterium]|nr:TlpA disulfide reductase family protein [Pseudobdellovibrionaceae bacterium]